MRAEDEVDAPVAPRTGACAGRGAARGRRRSGSGRPAARARRGRGATRRSTRGSPPSSSAANASAVARLPTPAGPWKRYACAGPSASAAASRRFASPCSGMLSKLVEDLLGDLVAAGACRRSADDSLREGGRRARGRPRSTRARNSSSSRSIRSPGSQPTRRADSSGSTSSRKVRSGRTPRDRVQVQLEHAVDARARARSPGRRATSRGSGRRPRRRRGASAGAITSLDELRAGRGEERGLGPGRDLACRRGAAPGSARRARCRPARAWRRPRGRRPRAPRRAAAPGWTCRSRRALRRSRTPRRLGYEPRAGDRDRGRGLHRLARGRRAARPRRRGASSSTTSRTGSARTSPRARELDVARHPRAARRRSSTGGPRSCFHLAAQADVRVSVERPDHDADVNVLGTIQRARGGAAARDAGRLRLDRRRDLRRVRRARARGRPSGGRSRPTASRSSPARSTSPPTTGSTGRGTSRSATATSTGRGRTRTARPAWSRSSSRGSRPARRRGSSATAGRRATTSTRATSRGRRSPPLGRRRRLQRRHRPGDLGGRAVRAAAAGSRAPSSSRSSRDARLGELQRSVLDVSRAERELGWRPETRLEDGLRLTWDSLA